MSAKPLAIFVPHTHWDREWRYPLWKNRMLLVEFFDELLTTLDRDPAFTQFIIDGQMAPVEDYLEIRPERRADLAKHVATGRLKVGPWYTLPDLYPLDGECLVRNLVTGIRLARPLGGHLDIGYNSFGWGQTAQFPQIYAGFGFTFIVAAKKVSHQRAPHCEYLWQAPDGTAVVSSRLGQHGRANFFVNGWIDVRQGLEYHHPEFVFRWEKAGVVYHEADADQGYKDWFSLSTNAGYHPDKLAEAGNRGWAAMDETLVPSVRLLMSGCDFTCPQSILPRIAKDMNAALPDREWRMGTMEEYRDHLLRVLDPAKLPLVEGELRDGSGPDNSGNALATRIHLKLLNKQVENVLIRRAEPLATLAALHGAEYPQGFLRLAWRHLLQAHPHDSINGVTQDKTADDTRNRLQNALEIAEVVAEKSIATLISRLDLSGCAAEDLLLLVVNPAPRPVRDVVRAIIDTPQERGIWDVTVNDVASGAALGVQHISRQSFTKPVNDLEARPWPFALDRHEVVIETGEIPAGGWAVLRVTGRRNFNRKAEFWAPTFLTGYDEIGRPDGTLDNGLLRVAVEPGGTLRLTDLRDGRSYPGLHWFEDTGEVGDYWVSYPPYHNATLSSRAGSARSWIEENGPLSATVAVEVTLRVPTHGEKPYAGISGPSARSPELVDLVITSRFTLRRGQARLDVRTSCRNTARDHRLRVALPTGLAATHSAAHGHFVVDERPVIPAKESANGWFNERRTNPMGPFVDVSDGQQGFAVLSDSLTEFELADTPDRTLFLTLFRAVRNSICTEFRSGGNFPDQHGGQVLQDMEWRYSLVPHTGSWRDAGLPSLAANFNSRPVVYQITPHSRGPLPLRGPGVQVDGGQIQVAAIKRCEDRPTWIVRLWNPLAEVATARIRWPGQVTQAWTTNLDELRQDELPSAADGVVSVPVRGHGIVTVEIAG